MSINKTIKKLLSGALGFNGDSVVDRTAQFEDLCGVWSKADLKEFQSATTDFEDVDPEDWK